MKNKLYILVVGIMLAAMIASPAMAAQTKPTMEYQIKAAFLYNFTKFVDWPEEKDETKNKNETKDKNENTNKTITIGIIGKSPFGNAFAPILKKKNKDKKLIIIKTFETLKDKRLWNKHIDDLKKCHLLFFCASEQNYAAEIMKTLKDAPILTVGETAGFLEKGGIIKFVVDKKKVRFEVNMTNAEKNGLNIRSRLLRLAKNVIKEKKSKDTEG